MTRRAQDREVYRTPLTPADRLVVAAWSASIVLALTVVGLFIAAIWTNHTDQVDDLSNRLGSTAALVLFLTIGASVGAIVLTAQHRKIDRWWSSR